VACEALADGVTDGAGVVAEGAEEGSGVELAVAEGSGVAVLLLALGLGVGDALLVGLGVLFAFGSLTWVIVVPLPPDRACPEISSKPVRAAAAMANIANVPTTMPFQFSRPRGGRGGRPPPEEAGG
jgi:hypothetical protein